MYIYIYMRSLLRKLSLPVSPSGEKAIYNFTAIPQTLLGSRKLFKGVSKKKKKKKAADQMMI